MMINNNVLSKISEYFITVDELIFLYSEFLDLKWNISLTPGSLLKLERLHYYENKTVTPTGESILFDCIGKLPSIEVPKPTGDRFDEIWLMFPRDDQYRHFDKTRPIRYNKIVTRKAYQDLINNGVTHEDLVKGLENELIYRKDSSTVNLLKYMKASANWFETQQYLEFMNTEDSAKDQYGKALS